MYASSGHMQDFMPIDELVDRDAMCDVVFTQIRKQIEFYFSDDNLNHDLFLRSIMRGLRQPADASGFQSVNYLSSGNIEDVAAAIDASQDLELSRIGPRCAGATTRTCGQSIWTRTSATKFDAAAVQESLEQQLLQQQRREESHDENQIDDAEDRNYDEAGEILAPSAASRPEPQQEELPANDAAQHFSASLPQDIGRSTASDSRTAQTGSDATVRSGRRWCNVGVPEGALAAAEISGSSASAAAAGSSSRTSWTSCSTETERPPRCSRLLARRPAACGPAPAARRQQPVPGDLNYRGRSVRVRSQRLIIVAPYGGGALRIGRSAAGALQQRHGGGGSGATAKHRAETGARRLTTQIDDGLVNYEAEIWRVAGAAAGRLPRGSSPCLPAAHRSEISRMVVVRAPPPPRRRNLERVAMGNRDRKSAGFGRASARNEKRGLAGASAAPQQPPPPAAAASPPPPPSSAYSAMGQAGRPSGRFFPVPASRQGGRPRKQKTRHSANPPQEQSIGYVSTEFSSVASSLPNNLPSCVPQCPPATGVHPSQVLLQEQGFNFVDYNHYHRRCLQGRPGHSQEMNTLYRLVILLRDNFNWKMYHEFRRVALEDSAAGTATAWSACSASIPYGLEKRFPQGHLPRLQRGDAERLQIWPAVRSGEVLALFRYSTIDPDALEMSPVLREALTRYTSIEHFRSDKFIPPQGFFVRKRNRNSRCYSESEGAAAASSCCLLSMFY
uniref:HTH La-type RNA-binding domain-containing protein n=1 Tax=Macrostomum lignano TaxID=282301 RepID=A0A1I8JQ99_9PLAT